MVGECRNCEEFQLSGVYLESVFTFNVYIFVIKVSQGIKGEVFGRGCMGLRSYILQVENIKYAQCDNRNKTLLNNISNMPWQ